jgi:Coenzyme PQQ synthesis protein D (PqqD)
MQGQARFQLNSPNVIAEVIDGEAILVDLRSGNYFSIQGNGALLWEAIAQGASLETIASQIVDAFDLDRAAAEETVVSFSNELEREGLIVAMESDQPHPEPPLDFRGSTNGQGFTTPVVEKYTDMQDLVLLDPVHEVDERGWPHAQP